MKQKGREKKGVRWGEGGERTTIKVGKYHVVEKLHNGHMKLKKRSSFSW